MRRYQPLLFEPAPPAAMARLHEAVQQMRAAFFAEIPGEIEVRFAAEGPLAFVLNRFMHSDGHLVAFHPVLEHPATPIEVIRFIAKHELTHIAVPGRFIGGRYESHPEEFWAHELRVGPEHRAVWAWIHGNLAPCLRRVNDGTQVTRRWMQLQRRPRGPFTPMLPFRGERWDRVCPGDGAQLRLPASWAPPPLR
ncbi:MAG: hypothetical protein U0547_12015 [Dehalococcoidia bacterium]